MDGIKRYAAVLSLTEVGLGSILHAFHVPLAGHALSLNQGAILTFALKRAPTWRKGIESSGAISLAAAGMKTFSPAGKRLTPMLGITMQGMLYALGVALGGRGLVGVLLGMALLSVWAFVQPVVLAWVIFGQELFHSVVELWRSVTEKLGLPMELGLWALAGIVAVKFMAALAVGVVSWMAAPSKEERYIEGLRERMERQMQRMRGEDEGVAMGALRDIVRPWFLASFVISVGCFMAFRNVSAEGVVVYALRVLLVGWGAFVFLRWAGKRWGSDF